MPARPCFSGKKQQMRSSDRIRKAIIDLLRGLVLCSFLIGAPPAHGQRSEDWLPLTSQDRRIKDVPGEQGAAAVQLYYADFRDDNRQHQFIYHRIKILNDSGKQYANIQIVVPQRYTISDIQARTIHPDGSIVEFTGRPYERLISRWREDRQVARILTLPGVTVGSIVEYKYQLSWEKYLPDAVWTIQHDLYTLRENFWLRPYTGPLRTRHVADETQLSYVYSNMPQGVAPKESGAGVELIVENVPAFRAEPYMPPESNFKAEVRFFYGGREIESPEGFWRDLGREWYARSERFIGNHSEIRAAAAQITGAETDPQQKLWKLYERVQKIRNLNFERERTPQEDKKEELKANESVLDVLVHGYGYENEIAELFVALARAAGFEPELLRVSSRRDRIFDPKLLSEEQLQAEIVRVNLKGAQLYLDPGTRFCPFGMLPWDFTSAPALKLDKAGGQFVVVPTATADKNVVRRTAGVVLDRDGSARADITLEFKGSMALDRRLGALDLDEPGRRQALEEEVEDWLPRGCTAHLAGVSGWDSAEEPLIARFVVEIPRFAVASGNRLLFPANLFRSGEVEAFSASLHERKYPVYFPYTYEEIDNLSVKPPAAYKMETLPNGVDVKLASTRLLTTRTAKEDQPIATRALVVNSIYFQPEQYEALKAFFDKVTAADEEQIIFKAP